MASLETGVFEGGPFAAAAEQRLKGRNLPPECLERGGVLPTLPNFDPSLAKSIYKLQVKYPSKAAFDAAVKSSKLVAPPPLIRLLLQRQGACGPDLSDPAVQRLLLK